jgi:DNA processing protein
LLEIFGSAIESLARLPDFSAQGGLRRAIKIISTNEIETELAKCAKFGAKMLVFFDDDYPRLLREISDPPPIITIFGKKELLNQDSIAIVGPRNASFHACKFAKKVAYELGQNAVTTVSGMAKGLDAAAHEGSIATGTVAVIAGGIDHIYPKENTALYGKIAKQGVIVSEQAFGAAPKGPNFVQRNRIISGMSYGVLVVEAGLQSGSLITARCALDQGREVFAVPGFPEDPRNFGSNRLIIDGAIFTQGAGEIMAEMNALRARFSEAGMLREPETDGFVVGLRLPSDDDITKIREEISQKISFIPIQIGEIIREVGAPARLVNIALVQLELADIITINFGMVVRK